MPWHVPFLIAWIASRWHKVRTHQVISWVCAKLWKPRCIATRWVMTTCDGTRHAKLNSMQVAAYASSRQVSKKKYIYITIRRLGFDSRDSTNCWEDLGVPVHPIIFVEPQPEPDFVGDPWRSLGASNNACYAWSKHSWKPELHLDKSWKCQETQVGSCWDKFSNTSPFLLSSRPRVIQL